MSKKTEASVNCECGAPGVPIAYGEPGDEMFAAADRGEIYLGGCVIEDGQPDLWCETCSRGFRSDGKPVKADWQDD